MSNKAIFEQIKLALSNAPRNQYTVELHLQMIKFADELKHITAKEFCEEFSYKICFDISHSKLACNHYNWSFSDFIKKVIPFTSHMHIADAAGKDGEGLGVGEGEIDFSIFKNITENKNYDLSFIPEIWQGHKNNGQGFWESLEKLESFF